MRIAFVLPQNGISGGIFVTYIQAKALQELGNSITVVFEKYDAEKGMEHYGVLPFEFLTLAEAQGREFDVVIATWWETFFSIFKISSKYHFYFCQSDERRFYDEQDYVNRHFVSLTYSFPNVGIITEAKWIKNFLELEFGAKVEYAPNGVDLNLFCQNGPKKAEKGDTLRVLIEGPGATRFKRIDDAFRIANSVAGVEVWYVSSDGHTKPHWRYEKLFKEVPYTEMGTIYTSI